jgi:hypothetical protein
MSGRSHIRTMASMPPTTQFLLQLEWVDDLPVGSIGLAAGGGEPVAFRGWLELAAAVRALGPSAAG